MLYYQQTLYAHLSELWGSVGQVWVDQMLATTMLPFQMNVTGTFQFYIIGKQGHCPSDKL